MALVEVRSCRFVKRFNTSATVNAVFVTGSTGSASRGSVSLKGRSCLTLKDFSSDEIKSVLWASKDLKQRIKLEKQVAKRLYL